MTTITIDRKLLKEVVELFDSAISARYPHEILRDIRAVLEAPANDVVVTKNEAGQIVAVTRQDEDGRIVEVIAESVPATAPEPLFAELIAQHEGLAEELAAMDAPATAPAQPDQAFVCSLGCTTECLARQHGVPSECPSLPKQPATAPAQPAWHDAPTCAGLWMNGINRHAQVVSQRHVDAGMLTEVNGQWYGPIPPDGEQL